MDHSICLTMNAVQGSYSVEGIVPRRDCVSAGGYHPARLPDTVLVWAGAFYGLVGVFAAALPI